MKILKILILTILVIGIKCQYSNYCSDDPRCRCHSIVSNCVRVGLSRIPRIQSNSIILDLRENYITRIDYGIFFTLRKLRSLFLNNNRITELEAYAFAGLDELKDLHLYGNSIERIHSYAFTNLRNLETLYLQQNRIKKLDSGTLENLLKLERLLLSSNLITTFQEDLIKPLINLKSIGLDDNHLNCDCDMYWLWQTIKPATHQFRSYNFVITATCYTPTELRNKKISQLDKLDFKCVEPLIVEAPKDVEISSNSINSLVQFECKAIGHPVPTIQWFKNGHRLFSSKYTISNEGNLLMIPNVNDNDAGRYECLALSDFGETKASAELKIIHESFDELQFNKHENEKSKIDNFIVENDITILDSNDEQLKIPIDRYANSVSFLKIPNDLTVTEGSAATLSCQSSRYSDKVTWIKDGALVENNYRVRIKHNGDLEIQRTIIEDEGFYVCSIGSYENIKYAQAKLTVNVPATFIKRPVNASAIEGDYAEFYCKVSGKPEPKIIWKKDGNNIEKIIKQNLILSEYEFYQNNQLLRIKNLNREKHSGLYTCVAVNSVNTISSDVRLFITQAVKPYLTISQQNLSVYENQNTVLECFAEGKPKPQVLWYKNGQRVKTDSRVYFDSFGYLTFTQVQLIDAGNYICRAENIAGSASHKFSLSVKDIYGTVISDGFITQAVATARKEVNKQFQDSLNRLLKSRRPKTHSELMALIRFPKDNTLHLASSEEIYERALDLIFRHADNITFNLTKKDFKTQDLLTHRQLQQISDLSGCSRYKRKVDCSQKCLNYRSFDGTCNNLKNPRWGAANTALKRLAPAEYENGFSTPKGWNKSMLYNGYMLPNVRDLTTRLISTDKITSDEKFSLFLMQWGQFLDHDLGHTVMAISLNRFSNGIACRDSCTNEPPCFPIEVLPNDTRRNHLPGLCMEFIRSSAICGSGETSLLGGNVHQREQINQLTAFIDASNVYGSSDQDSFDIRERTINNGKLKVHSTSRFPKGFLPFNLDTPMDCHKDNKSTVGCFMAGDYRANEQLGLLAMHNLFVRHHNYMLDRLKFVNPHWFPEQLYQETRKIIGAQMQYITYEIWLPYVLGPAGMKQLGTYRGYDPNVDPTISNEFATAAFRFGHALIQPFTYRLNGSFQPIPEGNLLLRDSFFAPERFYHEGGLDPILRGLFGVAAKIKLPREIMNSELTEKLFHVSRTISLDLAALNIQRGRDHGIPSYVKYRKICNLREARNFEDLKSEISNKEVRNTLKKLYGDVRNIDLWLAGILEDVVEGSKMGPTFLCIITKQMRALRDGDRFWYENPSQFTSEQIAEIKKTSLAKIICENGDQIEHIQTDPFLNAKFPNEMLRCSQIRDISLEPWRNCCQNNPVGLCGEPSYFYASSEYSRNKRYVKNKN